MLKPRKSAVLLFWMAVTVGCATGYEKFYMSLPGTETFLQMRAGPPPLEPLVEYSPSLKEPNQSGAFFRAYLRRGLVPIGMSSFVSAQSEPERGAIQQAKSVGADLVVIMQPEYKGTTTFDVPLTLPSVAQTFSTGHATAYGPGGPLAVYGVGSATTYSARTMYIPVVQHIVEYGAIYFVKIRPSFGALFRDLSDNERAWLQRNRGAVVDLILDSSPAFESDLLVGDVVLAIDDVEVINSEQAQKLVQQGIGRVVSIRIMRNGRILEKEVRLRP